MSNFSSRRRPSLLAWACTSTFFPSRCALAIISLICASLKSFLPSYGSSFK